MLEGLAAWVLNTYVGEYVENLNTDQLSIALLQGDVELENLPLKKNALKTLDIPLEVKSGVIGKIILHIPLRGLRSEAWSISIEDLYLVAGPLTHLQYDETSERETKEAAKKAMLDALEAKWKILRQDRQDWATSSWFSYGTSMATNILENIQLKVKNVHIRYEDQKLNPDSPFAFGIIIDNLSAQSTDDGKNESKDIMYKLVDLQHFSIYCDSGTTMLGSLPPQQFREEMQKDMKQYNMNSEDLHDYILKPISASAKVKRYTSALPLRSTTTPRITVDFIMEAINFQLCQDQFKFLGLWNREFERHNRRRKYRKNRPEKTFKESPAKWWKFAINCHLNRITEDNQRKTWDYVLYRSRVLVDYYDCYLAHLLEGGSNQDNEYRKKKIEAELEYEELKIIRELVLSKLQSDSKLASIQSFQSASSGKSSSSTEITKPENQPGLFQKWFPGWGGWSQTSTEQMPIDSQSEISSSNLDQSASSEGILAGDVPTEIEREIMDVIHDSTENSSFLRKDTIFAKMKFTLNQGSFQLLENTASNIDKRKSVADLQCSTITMEFESRPRTSAMKFSLAVQGLQIEDTYNHFKSFPFLITPQSQTSYPRSPPTITILKPDQSESKDLEQPFCQIVFEKNPVTHFHRYRAAVKTRPIDIVYNPVAIKRIKDFFTLPSSGIYKLGSMAHRSKFGTLRKQTQEELQRTLTQFLESNQGKSKTRWDINLDISAPKFIIPENLADPNSVMVVLDLGNFKLQTQTSQSLKHTSPNSPRLDEDVNEDDFHTPLSTPPNEYDEAIGRPLSTSGNINSPTSSLSSDALHDHFYETFILDLTDLQVLQGRSEDNWRYAYYKGTSQMHVIDKFTISLQLERRLVSLSDPQLPNMTISGNLPFLTFHLNETKILALQNCWDTLTTPNTDSVITSQSYTSIDTLSQKGSDTEISEERYSKSEDSSADSCLIVFRFFINKLSLELQSRGRALVELQVTGVEANLSQKKLNTSLALTVHSLLIVDALQSYGPDFELLVASHKNLMLDSRSGSILGSNPASPASPQSPNSPVEEKTTCLPTTSFHAIQDVITQAFQKVTSASRCSVPSEPLDSLSGMESESRNNKMEALISLEFEVIKSEQADNTIQTDLQLLNLQFNSLDLIANQETLVELISFMNRTSSNKGRQSSKSSTASIHKTVVENNETKLDNNFHINADFCRLNILLPHFLQENGRKVGHKIATATMSTAKVEAIFGEDWQIQGALGGLHLSDVTPEGSRYHQVFSIGDCDPTTSLATAGMFKTATEESMFSPYFSTKKRACSFTISKSVKHKNHLDGSVKSSDTICANFEMGSVCYTHCPKFLDELTNCLSAFHDYMSMVATSIKTAATEVAYGLVGGRGDNLDNTGLNFSKRDISLSDMSGILLEGEESFSLDDQNTSVIKIMAHMETPILVIPRAPNSSHVLLAHLGQMTITNSPKLPDYGSSYENLAEPSDKIHISLSNMNLFSADLEKLGILRPLGSKTLDLGSKKSFYSMLSEERGSPIIYNTAVDLVITQDNAEINYINPKSTTGDPKGFHLGTSADDSITMTTTNSVMDVCARIKTPFKVVLSKEVYEQFLQTLDNLTYNEDVVKSSGTKLEQESASVSASEESESSHLPSQNASDANQIETFMAKHFRFEVPLFEAELRGDFNDGEQGVANLKLHDFSLKFRKDNNYLTNIEFRLRSLTMEDLLENEDSQHRHIMVSQNSPNKKESKHEYLSTSCPDSTIITPIPTMPHSLPSSFQDDPVFSNFQATSSKAKPHFGRSQSAKASMYPCTPPPSPRDTDTPRQGSEDQDDLVYIDLTLVDKKSQEYIDRYDKTNRFIDVKFRCLETTINLQTWVVLLDFLGMGAKIADMSTSDLLTDSLLPKQEEEEEHVNSKINFSVESFTLVLNKKDYELARANITHLDANIDQRYGNLEVKGQLGSISLLDNSPSGELYRERFISIGKQALEFYFFKHGLPDYNLQREYDINLQLNMSSVRYTHTNRFQSEMLAFVQHFLQLQDVLGRMRAASAGKMITDKAMRGARVKLDIEAGSPILLIPQSSKTDAVLVADLGKLRVTNCFKLDGTPGTVTYFDTQEKEKRSASFGSTASTSTPKKKDCEHSMSESMFAEFLPKPSLDPMSASIIGSLDQDIRDDQDLLVVGEGLPTVNDPPSPDVMSSSVDPPLLSSQSSVQKSSGSDQNYCTASHDSTDSVYKCLLDVWKVTLTDMDLYTAKRINKKDYKKQTLLRDLEFSFCIVQEEVGRLLEDTCVLELSIERNLEGDISHTAPDWRMTGKLSSVFCHLDLNQYKLIRGILDHNLGEPVEEFERPLMSHLKDPSIQTILSGEVYNCINMVLDLRNVTVELLQSHSPEVSLAKLDFISSKLTYESSSNQSKDVSLFSHAIVVSDTRYKDQPMNARPNVFVNILQPKKDTYKEELQLELHYRSTKESTQFTVLLNKMKVMCIFDWLVCVKEFLLTTPDNPFQSVSQKSSTTMLSPEPGPSRHRGASPLNISQSLATKRGPFPEEVKVPFQGKLNLQETSLIVVGDTTSLDTSAVILQSTAVIMFKPQASDKVLVCDLQSVEVFSCCLMALEETAQSIIDPVAISIDLNANPPVNLRPRKSGGLLEAKEVLARKLLLQINFSILNIRVSYQDMMLFKAIFNNLPEQALKAKQSSTSTKSDSSVPVDIEKLMSMGFDKADCFYALQHCHGDVGDSAIWLTKYAKISEQQEEKGADFTLTGIELKATSIYLCLIDDCGSDVPLAELSFNGIDIHQTMEESDVDGKAKINILGSYYNRNLSGWEPFLESWPCYVEWKTYKEPTEKLAVQVSSPEVLNINVTSTMMKQYNETKGTWTEDYTKLRSCGVQGKNTGKSKVIFPVQRRRSPFIPYKLINKTGCKLSFTVATTTPTSSQSEFGLPILDDKFIVSPREGWNDVMPDEVQPFTFQRKEKTRHKKTQEMYHNQLVVRVDGWQKPSAICVDKVGVYFRHVNGENVSPYKEPLFPTRIKFEVKQVGSAGKIIIISSALMVVNKLDSPVEVLLESTDLTGGCDKFVIPPDIPTPLPIRRVYDKIWARPHELSLDYCDEPINWQNVVQTGETSDGIKQCTPHDGPGVYRFCVSVKRENYPSNEEVAMELELEDPKSILNIPGHTIILLPPLTVKSLLPIELHYYLKNTSISGNLKGCKDAAIHAADTTKDFEIGIHLENFESCREVNIPPRPSYKYRVKLRIYDKSDRLLELTMRIQSGRGGSIWVSIAAPYWIVNKSGLPLLFKQEGTKTEGGGQFEEHEIARSVTPLLFSYNEKDEPSLVSIRLGKKHHGDEALPIWCNKLSLENGSGTRQLHVVPRQNRPDWVYNIGYQVTKGKGKFRDTNVITIAPRYEVDNQSNFKLAIAQKYLISSQYTENSFLTALPKCKLPYHWPRMDLDQLLCVKIMDHPSCHWSGGFCVDKSKSFHVNMRDGEGRCMLLKVEIILQGPTFVIVLANAETMPAPFRLDNHSPIAVRFYQSEVTDHNLQTFLRPNTSILYAWDEPILEPVLSLQIPSGMTANYNLNQLGEGSQLLYENYIYLAATHTFNRPISSGRELVLDCTHENHLVFKRKEKDKRSQMWRMTSDGMLEHYGSVPPTEPGSTSKTRPRGLVLDILDMAPQPTQCIPLFLRKPDERRNSTQTWKFTEDGLLVSSAGPMCVQVLGGVNLLQDGAIAVLGPSPNFVKHIPGSPVETCPVPPHMMISRQKLRPGSGCLSVKVVMDGPIRVLEITDRQHAQAVIQCNVKDLTDWEVYDVSNRPDLHQNKDNVTFKQLEVVMSLKGGLGISLINHIPEELIYIKLSNISMEIIQTDSLTTLETSVASVQVDNQMFGAVRPVVLFVTQTTQRDGVDNTPAIFITAHKLPSGKWNAEIYKHLIVTTKRLTIQLEERLLWKLLPFLGYTPNGSDMDKVDDNTQQVVSTSSSIQAKRYYFGALKLKTGRVTLSMATASNLPPDLQIIKHSLSMPLIAFEDAKVDLDQFTMNHPFETSSFLFNEIMTHYTDELKGQATKILGSVDFLGNPLGFVNDVTEGISGLIKDGNVGGLFKNVTHGVSNTAAKMTSALSDGFATVSMDDEHNKTREEFRQVETGQSRSHLMAGVKGLGYGIYGGLTGIVTQSYSGAKEKGIQGFFKGAGKGLVGTVTKPVAGVLDFTSGVANAVRDKSQVSSKQHPPKSRDPRVNPGARGIVSPYSPSLARAQNLLYNLNNNNYSEYIIALEYLGYGENSLLSMVSSHYVRILKRESKPSDIILSAKLNDIVQAEYTVEYSDEGDPPLSENENRRLKEKIYLKLLMKADVNNSRDVIVKQPSIRCERINIAKKRSYFECFRNGNIIYIHTINDNALVKVRQQINYAKKLYEDETHTLIQTVQPED